MKREPATILREYGPFPNVTHVHGVSYDGANIWIATGITLNANEEIMFRWVDINDAGNDHGGAIDDLSITFTVPEPTTAALGGLATLALIFWRRNSSRR